MCRMLGIYTIKEISPLLLDEFAELSTKGVIKPVMQPGHPDGWGLAGYLGNWSTYFGRSEKSLAVDSANYNSAIKKAILSETKFLITHIRKASKGSALIENTHPFIHDEWIFAHNGTIFNSKNLVANDYKYEGETDSDRFFIFLIKKLSQKPMNNYIAIIKDALDEVKSLCQYTSLTFILTNGRCLIGYRDFTESENYYTLYYSLIDDGSVFLCSEPLYGLIYGITWNPLNNSELFYIDKFTKQKKIVNLSQLTY